MGAAGGVDEASPAEKAGKGKGGREPAMSSIGAETPADQSPADPAVSPPFCYLLAGLQTLQVELILL